MAVFRELNRYKTIPYIDDDKSEQLFACMEQRFAEGGYLDGGGGQDMAAVGVCSMGGVWMDEGGINQEQFAMIATMLQLTVSRANEPPPIDIFVEYCLGEYGGGEEDRGQEGAAAFKPAREEQGGREGMVDAFPAAPEGNGLEQQLLDSTRRGRRSEHAPRWMHICVGVLRVPFNIGMTCYI
jgi:hypothetical protein